MTGFLESGIGLKGFVEFFDGVAKGVFDGLKETFVGGGNYNGHNNGLSVEDELKLRRLSCYLTSLANTPFTNITATTTSSTKLLHSINPLTYFNETFPTISSHIPDNRQHKFHKVPRRTKLRRHYRLAYWIHIDRVDTNQLDHDHIIEGKIVELKRLVDLLDDGSAIFLIHVEQGDDLIWKEVEKFVRGRDQVVLDRNPVKGKIGNFGGGGGGDDKLTKPRQGTGKDIQSGDLGDHDSNNPATNNKNKLTKNNKTKTKHNNNTKNANPKHKNKNKSPNNNNNPPPPPPPSKKVLNPRGAYLTKKPKTKPLRFPKQDYGLTTQISSNIFLQKQRFKGINDDFNTFESVLAQLSGFWELHELADWEFIVNLRLGDFPFRYSREIHRFISTNFKKWSVFIDFEVTDEQQINLQIPQLKSKPSSPIEPIQLPISDFSSLVYCNQSSGMILSRQFVDHLRRSNDAYQMLALFEHIRNPSPGSYFCTDYRYKSSSSITMNTINESPAQRIDSGDRGIPAPPLYFFIEGLVKFDGYDEGNTELKDWIVANHLDVHLMPDLAYGYLPSKKFVQTLVKHKKSRQREVGEGNMKSEATVVLLVGNGQNLQEIDDILHYSISRNNNSIETEKLILGCGPLEDLNAKHAF
ncbi:hypothetical protein HDU76_012796 [Blyttiomyces sp. JEL0837]|nr:hypothetical protein HDU76_012796 [Blyttiomyces sp. JEL0837]